MNSTTQTLNAITPLRVGATIGKVKTLLRWEALLIMVGAIIVYVNLSGHWGMFAFTRIHSSQILAASINGFTDSGGQTMV